MSIDPTVAALADAACSAHAELDAETAVALPPLQLADDAPRASLVPGLTHAYVTGDAGGWTLHTGAFQELATSRLEVDGTEEVRAHLEMWAADQEAWAETQAGQDGEEALLGHHALFRRGEEVPHAWYRGGEALDAGVWAVDLDVFVEVWIDRYAWGRAAGNTIALHIGEDVLDVEVPADADSADILTLEGGGLFEDEPFEDEPLPPRGDLHIYFVVV